MKFKKLELKNFKSHANTTINFNDGITLIVGENGAGKSSIFEAITFALYKQSNLNNIDLVRTNKGISGKIEMEVKLTFNSHGTDYRIERKVVKNNGKAKSSAKLIKITELRDETIASKITEVDREIEQILSMDSSTFLNAIHIQQGQISDLIDKTPAERKELIGQLLKLDDLESAYKRLPDIRNEKIKESEFYKGKITNGADLNNQLEDAKKEQVILLKKDQVFINQLNEINNNLEIKIEQKEELDELENKFNKLNIEKTHQEDNLKTLNELKAKLNLDLDKILNDTQEMESLKPYCNQLEIFKEFKESFLIFNNLKNEEFFKSEIIKKIDKNKQILLNEKENHDKYLKLNDEVDKLKQEETQLISDVKHADGLENRKNDITNEIAQVNKNVDDFYNKSKDILSSFEIDDSINPIESSQDLIDLNNIVEKLSKENEEELNQIDTELKEFNDEKVRLSQQSDSLKEPLSDIKKLEGVCPTCQSKITDDKKEKLIKDYETTISNNNQRIDEIDKLSGDLTSKKSAINANLDDLKSILNNGKQIEIYIRQIDKLNVELEGIEASITETQGMKEKLEELQPTLKSKTEEFESLKIHYDEYIKAQTLLNSLDDETKVREELKTITGDIEKTKENLEKLIDSDSKLSLDIAEDDLNREIEFLTEKNTQYHTLAGSVNRKEEVENNIKSNAGEIGSKVKEIESLTNSIESCDYDKDTHDKVINDVERLSREVNALITNIEVNKNQLKNIEEKITEIDGKILANKKYIQRLNDLNEYIDLLEDFRQHYSKDGIQKELRAQSKPLIQKYTREFFEKFNFNYSDLILDEDYNITIYGPEGEIKLDMVSGGEEIAIALSLRLGITQVMAKGMIDTILLDEPTIHLDSYRKRELIDVLRSMTVIPQMIIVTHDSELESAADTIIKVKKEDGISKVKDNS